jgi:hypothetical protein
MNSGWMRFNLGLALVLLAGCSPYLYRDEITGLRNGITGVREGVNAAATSNTSALRVLEARSFVRETRPNRSALAVSPQCREWLDALDEGVTLTVSPTFTCDVILTEAGQQPAALEIRPLAARVQRANELLAGLEKYSAALVAITNADDSKELKAASSGMCTALTAVAAVAVPPGAAVVGPACTVFGAGLVLAMDTERYNALRANVIDMQDKYIARVEILLAENLRILTIARLESLRDTIASDLTLANRVRDRQPRPVADREQSALRLFDGVATVQALGRTDPADAAGKLTAAHTKLYEALRDHRGQDGAVSAAIADFLSSVAKLRTALGADA